MGLTQEQFAERADLDPKYYQHVEAGRKPNPGIETLLKLAKGTGWQLWELLKFDAPPLVAAEDPEGPTNTPPPGKRVRKPVRRKSG